MISLIDNEMVHLKVQLLEGLPFIHLEVKQWSPLLARQYKKTWKKILRDMGALGYGEVFILIPDDDPKLYKFETMFGFTEVERQDGKILMICGVEYGN